jgi:hypothetical protein
MKAIISFLVFLFSIFVHGQHTVSGIVVDEQNIPLTGANVYLEGTYDGASTDEDGVFFFSSSNSDVQTLVVSMLGFETFRKAADISSFISIKVKLKDNVNALDAVVLTAGTFEAGKSRVSVLKPLDIVTTAGAAGDIIGALTTLPGTQTVGEDGRLFVRGGEANETQTFVDGLRVAQPFGPTANNIPTRSRFSPFLFDGISFSTGGYSAEFGEALSSILSLNTIDTPTQNQTDISLMTVGIGVGNTQKRKQQSLTFNLNYINLEPYQKLVPQAVDWNAPVQSMGGEMVYRYQFKNGLLKVYGAFDITLLDINQEDINRSDKIRFDLKNQNFYGNVSYKGTINDDWLMHTGISFGTGTNRIGIDQDLINNKENALHLKWKITKRFTNRFKLTSGFDYFYTDFQETFTTVSPQSFSLGFDNHLGAAYLEADWFLNKKFAVKVGARGSRSELLHEHQISPRVSMAYKVSKVSQFSLAFGDFTQAPNADILKFHQDLRSERALHYIFNYQYQKEGRLLRAEAYFKDYQHLVTFDSERPQFNSVFTNNGFGYAKGLDIFWRDSKTFKGTDYWVSYSFIDSEREYLNFPNQATPSFIANHTFSLVTKHWIQKLTSQVGFSYTVNSGRPYNNPNKLEFMSGKTKPFQNLSFNWAYLITQQKILYFSVSNILGTDNVFGYQYANSPDLSGQFPRRAIGQPADRFFFVGFFWTISDNKKTNQLNTL